MQATEHRIVMRVLFHQALLYRSTGFVSVTQTTCTVYKLPPNLKLCAA